MDLIVYTSKIRKISDKMGIASPQKILSDEAVKEAGR